MATLGHVFWSKWKGDKELSNINTNVGLICYDSDDVASTKDPQFFSAYSKYSTDHIPLLRVPYLH